MSRQRKLRLARTMLIGLVLLAVIVVVIAEILSPSNGELQNTSVPGEAFDLADIDPAAGAVNPLPSAEPIPEGEVLSSFPHAARPSPGAPWSYSIHVENGLEWGDDFRSLIDRTLTDPRGWSLRRGFRKAEPAETPAFWIVLASPANVDRLCAPLKTEGSYSCGLTGIAVINAVRWRDGPVEPARSGWLNDSLETYRIMVLNHEIGHVLGLGHAGCAEAESPASIMAQQTIDLKGCLPNPWPLESDLHAVERLK